MKKLLYSCIAFCTLVLASCADQDVAETNATNNDGPGVKVSMTMEGEMQSDAAAATPNSRAIGYEVKDDNGFPTAKGLYNGVGASAQELATGTKVPVVLIFKSDNASQPVTKVMTQWTYTQGGKLTLEPSETFEMKSGTNLSQGTWYVCGILGGDLDNTNSNVKFDGFVGDYTPTTSGSKTTFGAEIPYVFGWRKLETNQAKKTIKTNHAVKFKQFGSIVRLKVTNNTGFSFKYNGVRIITSNILVGQFDLSSFDNVATSDLADTQDNALEHATSAAYKKVFEAFNFTQRPTTDAKITSLASTNKFSMHNDLSYYDYKFNDFVTLANSGSATGYVYVWMAPKQQTVNIYNKEENNGAPVETKQVSKTQFMLMAMPTETSAGNKVVPTSINMIPAYGTRADYVSGRNYPAKGSVVYNFPPLSYIAKHDNFGTEAELSSTANQDIAHTIRYTYSQVEANNASIPSNYFIAGNEYWRSLITQAYAFAGLGKSWSNATNSYSADYTYSMSMVSPAKLPGWSNTLLVYQTYSKAVKDKNGKNVAYMLGLSKKPDYISDDTEGQVYRGRTKNPAIRVRSGLGDNLNWITNNNYRYTVRYEKVGSTVEMKQRYLGPRFVLDMEDIDNEDFWNEVPSGFPEDAKRVIPLPGVYTFVEVSISGPRGKQQFWLLNQNSVGNSAQYWTLDDASPYARYALAKTGGPNANVTGYTDYTSDKDGKAPKQAVGFGMPDLSAGMGGFYYYVYRGTPVYQDNDLNPADPRYVKNLIMQVPVRLWRKTTPYAD
ncbi:MAG: hypothetical protein HXN28_08965 [Prevotella histicola]|uniref:hypothetical protein n=1 Tax=Prevotella histicola TaxID=470565 RepID=UPI001CAC156F|nr:hypothetical protein [Prevotella histicola]MBF1392690.1 hypothetical protein [Prevotella histicola]